jgi:alpha-galactosidase
MHTLNQPAFCIFKNPKSLSTMKRMVLLTGLLLWMGNALAQNVHLQKPEERIELRKARFQTGNDMNWRLPDFDDSKWPLIQTNVNWEIQGYTDYNGYAWYRIRVKIPLSLKMSSYWKDSIRLYLAEIDDVDQVFLNGIKIGQTGSFPEEPAGYISSWNTEREYHLSTRHPAIRWDKDNVIAIRVYDGGGGGGIFSGRPFINMMDISDAISFTTEDRLPETNGFSKNIIISNKSSLTIRGKLKWDFYEGFEYKVYQSGTQSVVLPPNSQQKIMIEAPVKEQPGLNITFVEKSSGRLQGWGQELPYILTPSVSAKPRINGAKITGVRPGAPFLFKIPVSGERPLRYEADNLPPGILLNPATGLLTGSIAEKGDYRVTLRAMNALGKAERVLTIRCGDTLALTPPMGWNSWNCWGLSVNEERVKASAQAMIDKGLANHGWTYINIDDGWEMPNRAADSSIIPNAKFPDMKRLGDWLHERGLKFGIYSSPGRFTCGGFPGSYKNELSDARSYAAWGIDYLKYDLCSYMELLSKDNTLEENQRPYIVMRDALKQQQRDIVFSLCQYGMKEVWKWGGEVNGNLWRTTGDITDTWESMSGIGFGQDKMAPYAGPGRWNDPDMLTVGMVGWGDKLHPSRLTPNEQYTHISLWSLLAAPLLLGCDLSRLDNFTLSLLTNDEVLDINQDPLGQSARRMVHSDSRQVWVKELEGGEKAIGLFNTSQRDYRHLYINWKELGMKIPVSVRDVWRQEAVPLRGDRISFIVPPHGVILLRVKP